MANVAGINPFKIESFSEQIASKKASELANALIKGNLHNLVQILEGSKEFDDEKKSEFSDRYKNALDSILPCVNVRKETSYRRFIELALKEVKNIEDSKIKVKDYDLNDEESKQFLDILADYLSFKEMQAIIAWFDLSEERILTGVRAQSEKQARRKQAYDKYNEKRRKNGNKPLKAFKASAEVISNIDEQSSEEKEVDEVNRLFDELIDAKRAVETKSELKEIQKRNNWFVRAEHLEVSNKFSNKYVNMLNKLK